MKSCKTCKFVEPHYLAGPTGFCRYSPPVIEWENQEGVWPSVDLEEDWCGKWDAPIPVERTDTRPSGEKADPLAHWNGTEYEPTAMADSRDSAEMPGV